MVFTNIARPATIQEAMGEDVKFIDLGLAEAWIDALESDRYSQATHTLRTTDNGFCCLGVLCDVAAKSDVIEGGWRPAHSASNIMAFEYAQEPGGFKFTECRVLPERLARRLGLGTAGEISRDAINSSYGIPFTIETTSGVMHDFTYLASANDSGHVSFHAIAAALRKWFALEKDGE